MPIKLLLFGFADQLTWLLFICHRELLLPPSPVLPVFDPEKFWAVLDGGSITGRPVSLLCLGGQLAKGSISSSPSLSLLTDGALKSDDELVRGGHSMSTGTHEPEVWDPEVGVRDLSDGTGCAGETVAAGTWDTMDGCFDGVLKSKGTVVDCVIWVLKSKGSTEGCFICKLESTERDGALVFLVGPQSSSHAEVLLADGIWAGCPMPPDTVGAEWIPFDNDGDAFTSVFPFSVTVTPRFSSILL
jgi:hypothetical protein